MEVSRLDEEVWGGRIGLEDAGALGVFVIASMLD